MKNSPAMSKDSPKTPGGISKSLLTPCRRLGLSRKWRKSTVSPFTSPVTTTVEEKTDIAEKEVGRKRKKIIETEVISTPTETTKQQHDCDPEIDNEMQTPIRNIELPLKKKSKTLISEIDEVNNQIDTPVINKSISTAIPVKKRSKTLLSAINNASEVGEELDTPKLGKRNSHSEDIVKDIPHSITEVATPVKLKSKSKSKKKSPRTKKIPEKENLIENIQNEGKKEKSPNNLTKECIVVIQKKIFKNIPIDDDTNSVENGINKTEHRKSTSQTLFDSDNDDVPLSYINKDNKITKAIDEDDDFKETDNIKQKKETKAIDKTTEKAKPVLNKANNLDHKATTKKTQMKTPDNNIKVLTKTNSKAKINITPSQLSEDEDDDFYEKKRTILVKKSYSKLAKPSKAKSTGSITQRDIDDLKSRIENKKKMLLAKAMSEDTKEVRELIKKWQKGCQDALIELMDIMKTKMADKQNMDYSEILQTLKIPSSLVGYDSENDCFVTPEDKNIILGDLD